MPAFMDLTGKRFGRLVAIRYIKQNDGHPSRGWLCQCDCGIQRVIASSALTSGAQKSCGCWNKERPHIVKIAQTHGMSKTRLYVAWRNMRIRCYNPKDKRYERYGGRGITVCDEWRNSFEAFRDWALSNGYSDELTIDRIDTNGSYNPSNCRFITRAENNANRNKWKRRKRA